jgi:hypothetical protein
LISAPGAQPHWARRWRAVSCSSGVNSSRHRGCRILQNEVFYGQVRPIPICHRTENRPPYLALRVKPNATEVPPHDLQGASRLNLLQEAVRSYLGHPDAPSHVSPEFLSESGFRFLTHLPYSLVTSLRLSAAPASPGSHRLSVSLRDPHRRWPAAALKACQRRLRCAIRRATCG